MVAYRALPSDAASTREDERDLIYLGMIALVDPPKPGVDQALRDLRQLGVSLKLVSGDSVLVAASIARSVGMSATASLTGRMVADRSGQALQQGARRCGW